MFIFSPYILLHFFQEKVPSPINKLYNPDGGSQSYTGRREGGKSKVEWNSETVMGGERREKQSLDTVEQSQSGEEDTLGRFSMHTETRHS